MNQRTFVPAQALASLVTAAACLLLTGHRSGFPAVVVFTVALVLWLAMAIAYAARTAARRRAPYPPVTAGEPVPAAEIFWRDPDYRDNRRHFDRRALISGTAGILLPFVLGIAIWRSPGYHGVLHTQAEAFFAVTLMVGVVAVLGSSMVDWYVIIPSVSGMFGPPAWWSDHSEPKEMRDRLKVHRRVVGQIWMLHRGVCEILCFSALALLLAIGLVAAGNALSHDRTLPAAIESLGGSGIAFSTLAYVGPRVRDAFEFMMSSPIGVGWWVSGEDKRGRPFDGLVIDVSIDPGIKIVDRNGHRRFVRLGKAKELTPVDGAGRPDPLADSPDKPWSQSMFELHFTNDPESSDSAKPSGVGRPAG